MQIGVPVRLTSKAVSNWPAWYRSKNCIRSNSKKNVLILLWLAVWPSVLYLKGKEMCTSWHKFIISIISTHLFSVQKFLSFIAWINKSNKTMNKPLLKCPGCCLSSSCPFCRNMLLKKTVFQELSNSFHFKWCVLTVDICASRYSCNLITYSFRCRMCFKCQEATVWPPAGKQFEIPVIIVIICNQTK